jgi:succinate-semialdehyde dehydrogenase/glutarate-semialdehyde dehydrogenase
MITEDGRAKVQGLVQDARDRGAQALTGGEVPARVGYFYPPTVLDHVDSGAALLHNEIFGPVAPIVRFHDDDDAVMQANATDFGLVAYLYTQDLRRGLSLSEQLESGMVGLNRGLVSDPSAPFGGVKHSGLGREGGHEGILEYTETKYISTEW